MTATVKTIEIISDNGNYSIKNISIIDNLEVTIKKLNCNKTVFTTTITLAIGEEKSLDFLSDGLYLITASVTAIKVEINSTSLNKIIKEVEYIICNCGCNSCDDCEDASLINKKLRLLNKIINYYLLNPSAYCNSIPQIENCTGCINRLDYLCETDNKVDEILLNKNILSFYLMFYLYELSITKNEEDVNKRFNYTVLRLCLDKHGFDMDCIEKESSDSDTPIIVRFWQLLEDTQDIDYVANNWDDGDYLNAVSAGTSTLNVANSSGINIPLQYVRCRVGMALVNVKNQNYSIFDAMQNDVTSLFTKLMLTNSNNEKTLIFISNLGYTGDGTFNYKIKFYIKKS